MFLLSENGGAVPYDPVPSTAMNIELQTRLDQGCIKFKMTPPPPGGHKMSPKFRFGALKLPQTKKK